MAESEVELGRGLAAMMRNEDTDDAEAAGQLLAETVLWWRLLARNPGKAIATRTEAPDDGSGMTAAEKAYHAAKQGRR